MKRLHIDDYKKQDRVYVKNISKSDVLFEIDLASGKSMQVIIPKTHIPIELTSYAKVEHLKNSHDLRLVLQPHKKLLQLMDTKEAEKILATEDASDELERLSMQNNVINEDNIKVNSLVEDTKDDGINIKVKAAIFNEDLDDRRKLLELKAISKSEKLSVDDYKYIVLNCDIKDIQKWVRSQTKV